MNLALDYASTHALEADSDYPYVGKTGLFKCKSNLDKEKVRVDDYSLVPPKNATALKAALMKEPISVAVAGYNAFLPSYTGGIITNITACNPAMVDHGALAVGYGKNETSGQEYYIVKNSWGDTWGEKGYFRVLVQEGDGMCGI